METIKQIARKTIINLPQNANWDTVFYELYVVKKIEDGLRAEAEGNIISHEEVKKRFMEK
ncbi:MAG: hypothetical protein H8E57_00895 [Candidatus Cloacimonetes bacterium]|nr:hypothetical protein [Candidatus Cloacimonadota bacterium]